MIHKLFMTGLLGCIGFCSASAQPRVLGVEELFRLADAHSKSLKVLLVLQVLILSKNLRVLLSKSLVQTFLLINNKCLI